MRKLIPIVLLLIVLTSCRVNISGQESRREGNIREMGSPPEFKNAMDSGVIIAEERHENFNLILIKNTQNENLSFFVVEMIHRRHGKSGSYKRKINVYKLTGHTGKILSLDEQNLKAYKRLPLHAICNFLNKQNVPRNFTKVAEIYGGTGYNNVTKRFGGYYRGLYLENDPYDASRIVSIDTPQSYLEAGPNYDSGPLHFNPNPSDSILHYREKGRPKWWYFDSSKRAGMVPPKEDSPKVKPTGSPNDSLPVYDLNYSCTKNWNFHIKIYPEAEKGKIQISKEPKADSFFTYSYGPIFNPANFSIWLGNKFPGISPDCAGAIADQINATIYLYLKCTLCANFQKGDSVKSTVKADTTRKGTGKVADKKAAGVALPDNVSILPTATTIMHPVYNTKAKPKRDTVH